VKRTWRASPGEWRGRLTAALRVVSRCFWLVVIGLEIVALALVAAAGGVLYGGYRSVQRVLPTEADVATYHPPSATKVYAADGELLATVFDEDTGYREIVSLEEVPVHVRQATISIEDRRFYKHRGLDAKGIVRAARENLRARSIEEGASTLTQQLARAIFLEPRPSFGRKLQEAVLAIHIERQYSKDEILEMYLNQVCYGHPAYGIQAAAKLFFGKDVGELTLSEGALLAGLLRNQDTYSPYKHPDRAKARRNEVLSDMVRDGYITPSEAEKAKKEGLGVKERAAAGLFSYRHPYYVTHALEELVVRYGYDAVYKGGLRVHTTMNPEIQAHAEEAIRSGVEKAKRMNCSQAATVVLDPATGDLLAIVGGVGFTPDDQNNRATQARRQPGSAFKAFVYTAAIEHGFTPQTAVSGSAISIRTGPGEYWTVKSNSKGASYSLAGALAGSVNPASARLVWRLGPSAVVEVAHRMGIRSHLDPVYSIALGSEEVTVLEMAAAYACFANGGVRVEPTTIDRVYNQEGVLIADPPPQRERALSMHTAYSMNGMLKGVVSHGTGAAARGLGAPTAGKTGTTDDNKDTWFVGLTPQLVTAVWAGNDVGRMNASAFGGGVCAPVFKDVMESALEAIGKDEDLDFPGPGDERIRKSINFDQALMGGQGEEEESEDTGAERGLLDLEGGGAARAPGGRVPSYVIPQSQPQERRGLLDL